MKRYNWFTIKKARKFLADHGIFWTETWIRIQVSSGKIASEKLYGSRIISKTELERIIEEKRRCAN